MSFLPVNPLDLTMWSITVVMHIIVPIVLLGLFVRYIQVDTHFHSIHLGKYPDLVSIIRASNLLVVAIMQACYHAYYFPVTEGFCAFAIRVFMGLPNVSKLHVFVFYVFRYTYLAKELKGKENKLVTISLLVLGIAISILGWIPLWPAKTFLDPYNICLVEIGEKFAPFFGVEFICEVLFGSLLLYLFTFPIESAAKNFKRNDVDSPKAGSSPRAPGTSSNVFNQIVRRTKLTCYVSFISGFVSTFVIVLVFIWYPTVYWLVFLSDILVSIDTFINCMSLLYTFHRFDDIFKLDSFWLSPKTPISTDDNRKASSGKNDSKEQHGPLGSALATSV